MTPASVLVVKPGLLTTVQDQGRWGFQSRGVPPAGPMDWYSMSLGNRLVGNPVHAACLEITLIGPELKFEGETEFAVTGAAFRMKLDGADLKQDRRIHAAAGSRLVFSEREAGTRSYLAVRRGFDVPEVLGSRATHVTSATGGWMGRRLVEGDRLPVGGTEHEEPLLVEGTARALVMPQGGARLRVIEGPHDHWFGHDAVEEFWKGRFTVTPQSNRMAYRLDGPAIRAARTDELISDVTPFGGVQIPPSGKPILLMADRATTGGYPMIATVITADLPMAGQLAPGEWIEFVPCTRSEALAALLAQQRTLL